MKRLLPAATAELERWRGEDLTLPIWWRDDDAVMPTPALERLIALADRFEAPLHLAVIPEPASAELADRVRTAPDIFALTHGWKHLNHAPPDQKKAEFGAHRPSGTMLEEIAAGRRRLDELFAAQALPVFTPPWNRIAPELLDGLPAIGFAAISTFTPRKAKFAARDLLQINTHLDPVAWKSGGGLLDPRLLDAQLARELAARRTGGADYAEPYGILTHHLVQDDATWAFTEAMLEVFASSRAAAWTPPLKEFRNASS
ncbi:polysaccharide deacetylase family protein [Mesorhizobium sp. KR9-304]|uniref:polysaccharide deacetylase family protein n=1 Tax=Mesorhizobium sp. KR9-304 TaxID=3156614 RepID=UPI0032B34BFE